MFVCIDYFSLSTYLAKLSPGSQSSLATHRAGKLPEIIVHPASRDPYQASPTFFQYPLQPPNQKNWHLSQPTILYISIDSLTQSVANNLTDFAKTAQGIAALVITAIAGTIHNNRARTVLWVDGSKLSQGNVGASVCWKERDRSKLENISVFLGKNKETVEAELWAIANGLEVARETALYSHNTPITIFRNSREALTTLGQLSFHTSTPYLRNPIYQETSDLERKGHSVTIWWILSHVGLVEHDKADQSARDKARKGENQ